jgi:hypothetical protein
MFKMALHEPFGHLQHKLWSKEGPEVKLAVWLPTSKSRESTRSQCVQVEYNTLLESSQGELQVFFRPHPNRRFEQEVMNAQSPGSLNRDNFETPLWESREKSAIRMQVQRRGTKNTIWGKVVASPESGPWWIKWVQGCPWLVPTPRVCRMSSNHLVVGVATPLWPSVGVKPNTWKSWELGVLRDSRMFRARQQGPKHLASRRSWCHWKSLET